MESSRQSQKILEESIYRSRQHSRLCPLSVKWNIVENFIIQMYSPPSRISPLHRGRHVCGLWRLFFEAVPAVELQTFRSRNCSQGQVSFIRNHSVGSWRRAFNVASIEKFLSLLEKVVARPNSLFTCNQTKLRSKFDWPAITKKREFLPSSFPPPFFFNPSSDFYFIVFLIRRGFPSLPRFVSTFFMKARLITSPDIILGLLGKSFSQQFVKIHEERFSSL